MAILLPFQCSSQVTMGILQSKQHRYSQNNQEPIAQLRDVP
jgi:hypothetical protein